jgi:hypothetical protein
VRHHERPRRRDGAQEGSGDDFGQRFGSHEQPFMPRKSRFIAPA